LVIGREAVTRSSRTKADFCWASPVAFACDVAAKNKTTNTTNRKLPVFPTQHLKGSQFDVAEQHKCIHPAKGNEQRGSVISEGFNENRF
jgi:hypothetical protein